MLSQIVIILISGGSSYLTAEDSEAQEICDLPIAIYQVNRHSLMTETLGSIRIDFLKDFGEFLIIGAPNPCTC